MANNFVFETPLPGSGFGFNVAGELIDRHIFTPALPVDTFITVTATTGVMEVAHELGSAGNPLVWPPHAGTSAVQPPRPQVVSWYPIPPVRTDVDGAYATDGRLSGRRSPSPRPRRGRFATLPLEL